ncbi:uncharacterized protein EHS24_001400 [Apiotrichum porosum]|uniref:MARVEL domain-containing protein n=1 Tax=Apiotrichum porosum TaxID=105984 RepID=A0A427XKJ5_9TREE|nr:uncharacterized protein EHS24_001400 [Apiotrichum porosum]RSH79358.1 hypothetical protein EHS24_001400 [Apiotrichum porosum]
MGNYDQHIQRGHPILFGLLLFFALIEGCITAWLVASYNNNDSYPSPSIRDRLKFLVFVSWWTVFFSAVYIASFFMAAMSVIASTASHAVFLILTWIFWLAGIASFTSAIGGTLHCGAQHALVYCSQLSAAEAFGWMSFIVVTVMLVFILLLGGVALRGGQRLSDGLVA